APLSLHAALPIFQFAKVDLRSQRSLFQKPKIQIRPRQIPLPLLAAMGTVYELALGFQGLDVTIASLTDSQRGTGLIQRSLRGVVVAIYECFDRPLTCAWSPLEPFEGLGLGGFR